MRLGVSFQTNVSFAYESQCGMTGEKKIWGVCGLSNHSREKPRAIDQNYEWNNNETTTMNICLAIRGPRTSLKQVMDA